MTTTKSLKVSERPLARDWLYAARYYLGGRRGILIVAALAVAGGLVSNWSWLVAAGIAPLLIGVLPCVAMCALGLCMSKMGGKSCSTQATPGTANDPSPEVVPVGPPKPISTGELNPSSVEVPPDALNDASSRLSQGNKTRA